MDVEVWRARLDLAPADVDRLHPDERARAERFVTDDLRRRYAAAHGMLRSVLGLGPDDVIDVGPHGKPALAGGPHFNLSHSGEVALVAVCRDAPVGVDVEQVRPVRDMQALAERIMSPDELQTFERVLTHTFFFEVWTRKEAVLKASGEGITKDLRSLSYEGWTVAPVDAGEGYLAAVAVQGAGLALDVRVRDWP